MISYSVYLLGNSSHRNTYIGQTKNLDKRISQHNGIIAGGAKYTKKGVGFWYLLEVIDGICSRGQAISLEKKLKKSIGKKARKNAFLKYKNRV